MAQIKIIFLLVLLILAHGCATTSMNKEVRKGQESKYITIPMDDKMSYRAVTNKLDEIKNNINLYYLGDKEMSIVLEDAENIRRLAIEENRRCFLRTVGKGIKYGVITGSALGLGMGVWAATEYDTENPETWSPIGSIVLLTGAGFIYGGAIGLGAGLGFGSTKRMAGTYTVKDEEIILLKKLVQKYNNIIERKEKNEN